MNIANCKLQIANLRKRRGFTLMELLIVMLIISILAALALTALQGAAEEAKADRTRVIIAKLDQLVMQRYDEYRTKPLPIRVPPGTAPRTAALYRLAAMRELMRMELPDRRSDVFDVTDLSYETVATAGLNNAALQRTYYRKAVTAVVGNNLNNWTVGHEGAECLYLIVSTMHDGDKNALDFFMPGEIGDVDEDGMREILDGWGNPIQFLRWAPAFTLENGAITLQSGNASVAPDSRDPVKADPRWSDVPSGNEPFELRPLIFSAGPDKGYDIATQMVDMDNTRDFRYSQTSTYTVAGSRLPNDPYFIPDPSWTGQLPIGTLGDINGNGYFEFADNITNHYQPTNTP
jgi:prepilin-type N-terminal cleavage/methylation domain-containing protein